MTKQEKQNQIYRNTRTSELYAQIMGAEESSSWFI